MAKMTEKGQFGLDLTKVAGNRSLESAESDLSTALVFLAKRPVCRKYLSAAKDRSRKTVVTQQPAMKRGFNPCAPMSDI